MTSGATRLFDRHVALVCMPAIVAILGAGVILDQARAAVILAASAFSVAFGATKSVGRSRWAAMVVTGLGMTVVAFAGTLAGLDPIAGAIGTATMAAIAGGLARRDTDRSWGWTQLLIAFLLANAFPGDVHEALRRAVLVATGLVVQCAVVRIMVIFLGTVPIVHPIRRAQVTIRDVRRHALRAAICVTASLLASNRLGLSHGYWAPMTASLVLQPGLRDTWTRGLGRIGGTLAGLVLGTLTIEAFGGRAAAVAILAIAGATAAFGLQNARYPIFTTAVTVFVLALLALGGAVVLSTDVERAAATLLGGALALAGSAIARRGTSAERDLRVDRGDRV